VARTKKQTTGKHSDQPGPSKKTVDFGLNLGGLLGKLGGLLEKVGELAEAGEHFTQSGEISGLDSGGKLRGVYGISIRSGLGQDGQQELKVEPFGNVHREPSGEPVVEDVREPIVDVYEEEDHVLVLAEIPGVSKKDVQLDLCGDRLTVCARRREKRYRKEVALPGKFSPEKMRWDCTNGILKIRLER